MSKKAAKRQGKHVTIYVAGNGALLDWNQSGTQYGFPQRISFKEWEEKYQEHTYLVEDPGYKAPPVIIPSKASIAQIKASFKKQKNKLAKEAPAKDEKREEGMRTLIRKVARWEGSQTEEDRLEAREWAKMMGELWPDTNDEIFAEFERAAVAINGEKKEKTD